MLLILTASHQRNLALAEAVHGEARRQVIPATLVDLTTLALPLYSSRRDDEDPGDDLRSLEERMAGARGLWICVPEYNGGVPPTLTNAIAWLSRRSTDFRALFNGKPVVLSTHSGGSGQKVLSALRVQLAHLGCLVLGRELLTNPQRPLNPASLKALMAQLGALLGSAVAPPR